MFGLLNVNKPRGLTSRDAVDRIQRLVRPTKVGHAGTLDPLATGVLVVCLGPATRLVEYIQRLPKRYHGTFLVGRSSATDDIDGEVRERPELPVPALAAVEAVLPQFVGSILQTPPVYSAIKRDGQRAYARARRGEAVEMTPRPVDVYALEIRRYEFPVLELEIVCGSGCYIRSLGRDIARAVATDAVMSALERTAIGPIRASEGYEPRDFTRANLAERMLSPLVVLGDLPRRVCDEGETERLANGLSIEPRDLPIDGEAVAVDSEGRLLSVLVPDRRGGWRPDKNFAHA